MGRTEPSVGRPPAAFRRDVRAKRAKATLNKVIPAVLAAHPRARKGMEASELIVDPPPPDSPPSQPRRGPKPTTKKAHADDGDTAGRGERRTAEEEEEEGESCKSRAGPRVLLRVADTLTAAYSLLLVPSPSPSSSSSSPADQRRDLSNREARVGILNMASPLSPGGGFLGGATGQEENLCGRTTLLPSLRDAFYRLPEVGAVFTPDVLVFRGLAAADADAEPPTQAKGDRWFVDTVSAAMLRMPEVDVDARSGWARYAAAADRELAARKMRAVLRVFRARGARRVVLGAWGCGAYGNPVGEIARAWRKVLLGSGGGSGGGNNSSNNADLKNGGKKGGKKKKEKPADSWEGIEEVVFAIRDEGMARAFATAFGEDLLELWDESEGGGDLSYEEDAEDAEDAKIKELRDKVRDMELRIEQARTPQLRAGLNSVLAGLRSQLPDGDDGGELPPHESDEQSIDEVSDSEEDDKATENGSDTDGKHQSQDGSGR
ncbi:hypothetical protein GGR52DRAFT_590354 [Hypoxylon sp. FL1284]|nr:hypothetical protein GGR52DRAFT_590354 [Hypoxylon sp. FL1284]